MAALEESRFKTQISTDSAGTHSYHVGHSPDERAVKTAADFDVDIGHLRARKVKASDFHHFDLIVAMDHSNFSDLKRIRPPDSTAQLTMMMEYHPLGSPAEVPDPYYGGMDGFRHMCELLESATAGLLTDLEERLDQ